MNHTPKEVIKLASPEVSDKLIPLWYVNVSDIIFKVTLECKFDTLTWQIRKIYTLRLVTQDNGLMV